MFKKFLIAAVLMTVLVPAALAQAVVGQPAPDFKGLDTKGATRSLSEFAGKIVVLEWTNHECPYVRKHYGSGNMQKLQKEAADQGAVWLRVISSAPGEQGHVSAIDADRIVAEKNAIATATILDESGVIGRSYGAKTTPHMFVVDQNGVLVYAGAIDDKPTTDAADIATAHNYVEAVLDDLKMGRQVSVGQTQAYGCGVKYAQ